MSSNIQDIVQVLSGLIFHRYGNMQYSYSSWNGGEDNKQLTIVFLKLPRNCYLNEGEILNTLYLYIFAYLPHISWCDLTQNTFWQSYKKLYKISNGVSYFFPLFTFFRWQHLKLCLFTEENLLPIEGFESKLEGRLFNWN